MFILITDQHLTWIDGSDTGTCSGLPIDYRWCSVATNKIEVEILDPVGTRNDNITTKVLPMQ